MNNRFRSPVPPSVPLLLVSAMSTLILLTGCSSFREINVDKEISTGVHEPGSAINSDYFVGKGAKLDLDFASGSRFYIEKGGTLAGLGSGVRSCTAYAEKGAKVEKKKEFKVIWVENARTAYAERDKIVEQEVGPAVVTTGVVAGASASTHYYDDDDDDYHYHDHSHRHGDARISGSSYEKKKKD